MINFWSAGLQQTTGNRRQATGDRHKSDKMLALQRMIENGS